MQKDITLQVGMITFNQKNYVRQAIESVLNQKTNFKFEILINDDCSTDGTAEIIREYEERYPDIIKAVYQTENQYSKGLAIMRNFIFPRVTAKYFAICEGDDFYCDDTKLQQQVDFLEAHPEYVGCFHPVKIIYEDNPNRIEYGSTKSELENDPVLTLEKELKANHIGTNTVMYRWMYNGQDIRDCFPDKILPGDWYIHLLHLKHGNVYHFSDEPMSVYRVNKGGIWGPLQHDRDLLNIKHGIRWINFYYSVYKNITNGSEQYKKEMLIPEMKCIINSNVKYGRWKELIAIFEKYKDLMSEFEPDDYEECRKCYEAEKKNLTCKQKNTFLQEIFSVKNSGNHKVFSVLGIHFKFKRKSKQKK